MKPQEPVVGTFDHQGRALSLCTGACRRRPKSDPFPCACLGLARGKTRAEAIRIVAGLQGVLGLLTREIHAGVAEVRYCPEVRQLELPLEQSGQELPTITTSRRSSPGTPGPYVDTPGLPRES